jgi:hypothetical protein
MTGRGVRRIVACLVAAVVAASVGGCFGGGGHAHPKPSPATARRLAHLRRLLPAGFVAPGKSTVVFHHERLRVAPAVGLRPSDVRLAPLPAGPLLRRILAVTLNLPVPLLVHPIFLSAERVRGGEELKVAAARLSPIPHHTALFILEGPSYRAEHLVAVGNGVAAGFVSLPTHMAPGQWYVVAEDLSTLRERGAHGFSGHAFIDVGVLTVR